MRLRVLGSGNGNPTARRGCPGHLVRGAGETALVDAGSGTLRALAVAGVDPGEVTAVLLTHLHIDHHLDLAALLFALRLPRYRGRGPLTVLGPPGLVKVLEAWKSAYGHWVEPNGYDLRVEECGPGERRVGALHAEAVAVPHGRAAALGWRLRERTDGPVLAMSGDTGEGPGAVAAGRDAGLFVLECTLPEGEAPIEHLTASAAGRVAAASGCRRLLLVHFPPGLEEGNVETAVRAAYPGPLALAEDGWEESL